MKIQKTNLILRILLLPIKLIFQLAFQIFVGIKLSIQWVLFGGDELTYSDQFGRAQISDLIEAVEKLTNENRKV